MIGWNVFCHTPLLSVTAYAALVVAATARDVASVDRSLEGVLRENRVVGATWAVVEFDGASRVRVFGDSSSRTDSPISTATRFRAGSLSKNLTALLALRLHAQDVIDLEAPCQLSGLMNGLGGAEATGVTLASLFEHTAGLPGSTYRDYATGSPNASTAEFLSAFAPFHIRWPPQRFFSYSNAGYGIAAAVLEQAADRSFDEMMHAEVFDPLGVDSASFLTEGDRPDLVATGHDRNGQPQSGWAMLARPAGSLTITAADLSKVVAMYLRRGRLEDGSEFVPEELIARMERGETSTASRAGVREASYGLGNFGFAIDGRIWRGHWGKTDGFLTNVGYLPDHGVGFVLMVNTDAPTAMSACRAILAKHLTGGIPEPARPATTCELIDPSVAGTYVNATHDMPMRDWLFRGLEQKRVQVQGNVLRVESLSPYGTSSEAYRPAATGGFMPDGLPVATAAAATIDGRRYWLEGEAFVRVTAAEAFVRRQLPLVATSSSILLLVSGVFGGVALLRGRTDQTEQRRRRWFITASAVASVGFLATFWLFVRFGLLGSSADLRLIGKITPLSITLTVGSVMAVVGGLAATPLAVARVTQKPRSLRSYAEALLCLPLLLVAIVWIGAGWFPLMTWR